MENEEESIKIIISSKVKEEKELSEKKMRKEKWKIIVE